MLTDEEKSVLLKVSNMESLLEVGRVAIEKELMSWRDERLQSFNRNNGLVIKEKDGTASSIIRFGPEAALRIGLRAIAEQV